MFFIALFILILFALAVIFVWLAENPGAVTIEWPWLGSIVEVSLLQALVVVTIIGFLVTVGWMLVWTVLNSPKSFGRWRSGRRRDKGYEALSKGLIAAGAGNAPLARKLSKDSAKLLDNEPLVALLDAQTAVLEGNRAEARSKFETMLESEDTKLLGLRGLYVEAEHEGISEASAHFAKEANKLAPDTPWASKAVFKAQVMDGEWEAALRTLGLNNSAGLLSKEEFKRKRAVLLTALATQEETATPERAKGNALAAHKLAPELIPAALVAARSAQRLGDIRKASKVLEATWKHQTHPEIAEEYIGMRKADSVSDRLKKAQVLARNQPDNFESHYIVAKAALDAGDFSVARKEMERALSLKPSERACLLMADVEEAEHGDRGRVREWLSRALTAPKDPTWIADGVVRETWAPFSPVTGKLDAFEWKAPPEQLINAALTADYGKLAMEPLPAPEPEEIVADLMKDDVEEAEVIDVTPTKLETEEAKTVEIAVTKNGPGTVTTEQKSDTEAKPDKSTIEKTVDAVAMGGSVGAVAAGAAGVAVSAISDELANDKSEDAPTPSEEDVKSSNDNASEAKQKDEALSQPHSPFRQVNLDEDQDGLVDNRPDDPGVKNEVPKKKGMFF